MSAVTLADGLPIWEGQAVRFGSPGRDRQGRYLVHGIEAGKAHLGWDHFVDPGALVCDLGHRPTFLALLVLCAERLGRSLYVHPTFAVVNGPSDVWISFDNPAALLALWQGVNQGGNQ